MSHTATDFRTILEHEWQRHRPPIAMGERRLALCVSAMRRATEALTADNARLRAALKPFADALDDRPDYYNGNQRLAAAINGVSLDDFKAARDAMRAQQIIDEAMKVRPSASAWARRWEV